MNTFNDLGGLGLICPDSIPTVFGILDPSIAPPLLYYSSIPIIVVSLLLGVFILRVSNGSQPGRLFMWVAIIYATILMEEAFGWIATHAVLVHFGWQIDTLFLGILPYLVVWFTYVFVRDEPMPTAWQWMLLIPLVPMFILAPTHFNLESFDLVNCEGIQGPLRSYVYIVQTAALALSFFLCMGKAHSSKNAQDRQRATLLGIGLVIFFGIYILSNVFGDATLVYQINLFGPIGMLAFLATIVFLMVRYHAFNARVLGAQALVGALVALTFATLFVRTIEIVHIVMAGTLFLVAILGFILIRSVKKEVALREDIELLARELEHTNSRLETLLHYVGHEVKGFLTKDIAAFSSLSDGDLGEIPETAKTFINQALIQSRGGARSVTDLLTASNLKKGTVTFAKEPFDFSTLVKDAAEKERPVAELKGLSLNVVVDEASSPYTYSGDREKLGDNVLRNVIDNAIKYTPTGSIEVSLKKENDRLVFAVKDTGVGITDEDKANLFTEGGHGKDSQKINVHSTGYGLFIAKQIVEAHGGIIRALSEGEGKGSVFVIELPVT